jgi:uncharacterized damage-inducible protein DinB
MERTFRPPRADEPTTLRAFLDYHRETLRMKCSGLTQEQLAQTLPPSEVTLGGIMRHLTCVESGWFGGFEGTPLMPPFDNAPWDEDPDWEWHTARDQTPEQLVELYAESCRRSDTVIDTALAADGVGLDGLSVDEEEGVGRFSLRWILLHMIEEYARHNGHADLIRESIDGQTGQ